MQIKVEPKVPNGTGALNDAGCTRGHVGLDNPHVYVREIVLLPP
jgi:hypothetical protein